MNKRLESYAKKRDFRRTKEPSGASSRGSRKTRNGTFVVQKHEASHLHYDVRLAIGGVLVSWAVPKGPSLDPADKRLAIRTEDHPLDYADFEGVIPQGEYGGGTVMIWDRGDFTCDGDPADALKAGELKLTLKGERLHGGFALVRMKTKDDDRENWLLIKERDENADEGADIDDFDTSVASGKTMKAITQDAKGAD